MSLSRVAVLASLLCVSALVADTVFVGADSVARRSAWAGDPPGSVEPAHGDGSGAPSLDAESVAAAVKAVRAIRASGDVEKAAREAQSLVAKCAGEAAAHVVAVHIVHQDLQKDLGRDSQVESEYRARAKAEGATATDLYLYGRLLRGTRAIQQYRAALKLDPAHFLALIGTGVELTAVRDHKGAEQVIEAAKASRPASGVPWNALGRLAEAQGDRAAAERNYRKAIEMDAALLVARVNLGVLLADIGREEEAVRVLQDAAKLDPAEPSPLIAIGMAYLRGDRDEDAVRYFEKALEADARSVASLNMVAAAYLNLGKQDLAEKALLRSIAIGPKSAVTWVQMGHLRLAQARWPLVHEAAAKALDADPECAGAHHVAGLAFDRQGEMRKAETELKKAVRADADSAVFHRSLAQFYGRQDRWKDAAKEFGAVCDATGNSPEARYDLALAHVGMSEPKKAVEILATVVADDAANTSAWIKLGILRRDRTRDVKGAIDAFKQYVARGGKDARVPQWIADLESKK